MGSRREERKKKRKKNGVHLRLKRYYNRITPGYTTSSARCVRLPLLLQTKPTSASSLLARTCGPFAGGFFRCSINTPHKHQQFYTTTNNNIVSNSACTLQPFFFFPHVSTFHLLDKPWSQVSSLLPPGCCLHFSSCIGFSTPTARRFFIECC